MTLVRCMACTSSMLGEIYRELLRERTSSECLTQIGILEPCVLEDWLLFSVLFISDKYSTKRVSGKVLHNLVSSSSEPPMP